MHIKSITLFKANHRVLHQYQQNHRISSNNNLTNFHRIRIAPLQLMIIYQARVMDYPKKVLAVKRGEGAERGTKTSILSLPGLLNCFSSYLKLIHFPFQEKVIFVMQKAVFKLSVRDSGLLLRYLSKISCFTFTAPY